MNLIVFPLKHENPFPVKVVTGVPAKISDNTLICVTGIGGAGVKVLDKVLSDFPEISNVCEFGTAALISKGEIGTLYECTTFYDLTGKILGSANKTSCLPTAAVTGDDCFYSGCKYDWNELVEMPLLYTMETLRFRSTALNFKKHFVSIRLVTDDGSGNVREEVVRQINRAKKEIKNLFYL